MLIARQPEAPAWKTVMGAQFLFAPIDRKALRRARRAAMKALNRDEHEGTNGGSAEEQLEDLGDELSHALLIDGILDWKDVCLMADGDDTAAGEPLLCTDENKALLLSDPITFDALDAVYVVPFAARERAKNVSAASPNGSGAAATGVNDTVNSPANPTKTGGAKPARTGSKRRKTKTPS